MIKRDPPFRDLGKGITNIHNLFHIQKLPLLELTFSFKLDKQ